MYPIHYGLNRNPFRVLPRAGEVFIGPQTAELVQSMKSGLAGHGAVMTVSGADGAGKTTLVAYGLDAIAAEKKVVSLGRTPIKAEDVLDSLLIMLEVENRPAERERRYAILRDALLQYEKAGRPVFIVVEAVQKIEPAVLAELSASTTADTEQSPGARIVLMGDDTTQSVLNDPVLMDLRQRITHRHTINALSDMETRGYLLHCFRAAGSDFTQLFESDSCTLVRKLCDGNPRAINKLVDAVLNAAAEQDLETISTLFIAEIAATDYDPQAGDFKFTTTALVSNTPDETLAAAIAAEDNDQLQRIADDISKADSLNDLDDVMAETLFGEEIAQAAAQAIGGAFAMEAANSDAADDAIESQTKQPAKG
jgi:type II secretory pathway predicted ATPase ExeA